jgi:hypothetical protein
MSPVLALSGHFNHRRECPLSGAKRKCACALQMSVSDPKQTLAAFQYASLSRYDALL